MAWLANRPRPTPRMVAAAVAVVTVVAIGAGLVLQGTQPRPSPSPGAASVPRAGTTPGAGPGDWAALDLEPIPAVAALEPTIQDETGIPSDAAFTLDSLVDEPAAELARRLEVSPAIALAVTPSTSGRATIRPTRPLQPGGTYRFALRAPGGSLAGSWLFRVRGAVQAISTIPGSRSTGVPVGTGIEVTFNQEGVADMANHFSIEPEVEGRFERHGRTQVFVPDSLAAATLYTVTIRAGLARTGTDLTLPSDVVIRFETAGPESRETRLRFGREIIEASPTERPVIAVRAVGPDVDEGTGTIPTDADVRVYRIPSPDAGASSLAAFLAAPRWSSYADPLIPTDGMTVAASFTATLERLQNDLLLIRFPAVLDAGAYVVEIDGPRKAHAFLQVTTVSAWVSAMSDRTVVWVNDVATGRPLVDATVALGDGPVFGRSNTNGLAIGDTPTGLLPPAAAGDADVPATPVLTIKSAAGDTLLVPFGIGADGDLYRGEWWEKTQPADETYWAMLFTDRGIYRTNDRIEIWGYLRARDGAGVPGSVEVRLVPPPTDDTRDKPAIASVVVRPGAVGAFTATLPVASMPLGTYQVEAVVDGRVVVSRSLEVTIIRKPPYQLALSTDRRAVIAGATVRWTAAATFFDGTPVPALELWLSGGETDGDVRATTDAAGLATVPLKARTTGFEGERWEDATTWDIQAGPAGPEAAEVYAPGSVVVFPSAYDLKASGVVNDGRLEVNGSLHAVDLAKVERQLAAGDWDGDAQGAPVAGKTVAVEVTELIPVRRLVGNEYDFVEKIVRPLYDYDIRRQQVRVLTVESAADGAVAFNLTIPDPSHEYEVVLTAEDTAGRTQTRTIQAGQPVLEWWAQAGVVFETAAGGPVESATYGVGDPVVWRMIDDGQSMPSGGDDRYLYLVAQRGLRSATVSDAATFRHTYGAADAPGIFVIGVRFTGTTYAPKAAGWANFDASERRINVAVSAASARYKPGEDVTLSVRTTRPNGTPVAATVVLQAVDEKLFAIGGAAVPQPLDDLYGRVDSGIVRLTATHQVPTMSGSEGEGGDTTGGSRSDFRDTLLFRELTTDPTGRASTTVKLADDLTSWHVIASAVTAGLEAGADDALVPVGLPLFVEATIADSYLVSDRPVIRLRAYGDALRAGDAVEFTVQSTSLGLAPQKMSGKAFEAVGLELPALSLGTRSIDVTVTATTRKDAAGNALTDRLVRSFEVVTSRMTAAETGYGLVRDGLPTVGAGSGLATYTFSDAGRGRFLPVLLGLSEPAGSRLDRALAQSVARQRLIADFGREPASLPPFAFDPDRYPVGVTESDDGGTRMGGAALLPHGGVDPWLAARIAILAPNTIDANRLREALAEIRGNPATLRDLSIATLAAFAAMGEPALDDLREARAADDLTPHELLYLALGFEAIGDDASAMAIERDLLDRYGERFGHQVRLRLGSAEATLEATALLSVVAAGLGDPVAAGLAEYVLGNPGKARTQALELAAYAARGLDRTPAGAVSFAYTVAGKRTVVRLETGDAFSLSLTSDQRSGLSAETISGQVAVAVEWREPVAPGTLVPHAALSITRTVPAGALPSDRLVVVDLTAKFADGAPENGCYDVVELVPSGLAPLAIGAAGPNEEGVIGPSSVVGQEVTFCAGNDPVTGHTARMRYAARVVNDGTFTWEPAIIQLASAPEVMALTPPGTGTIGRP